MTMDLPTASHLSTLMERVKFLRAEGDLTEALRVATELVEESEQALGDDSESRDAYATALKTRGGIDCELGSFEFACDDFLLAIEQLHDLPDRIPQLGRLCAALGSAYDGLGQNDLAAEYWQKAMGYFESENPPPMLDIAAMANNLGFLHKAAGDLDAAQVQFLRALEITSSQLGTEHEQTATISSNLGALYQAAGFHEQSLELHRAALETRRNLFGEIHPDTAQSHNNVALALFNTGDRVWARRHFENAVVGFERLGPKYHDDLEVVALNYCDLLRIDGDNKRAREIAYRVESEIGRPI